VAKTEEARWTVKASQAGREAIALAASSEDGGCQYVVVVRANCDGSLIVDDVASAISNSRAIDRLYSKGAAKLKVKRAVILSAVHNSLSVV
jgi:hypothetical protein